MSNSYRPGVYVRTQDALLVEQREKFDAYCNELKQKIREQESKIAELVELSKSQRTALYNAEIAKDGLRREIHRLTGVEPEVPVNPHWSFILSRYAKSLFPEMSPASEGKALVWKTHVMGEWGGVYQHKVPEISQVIYSGPKTIIMWKDGTKTMVSPSEDQQIDDYAAFCAAVVKKMFGATHKAKKFLAGVRKDQVKKPNKELTDVVPEIVNDPDWEDK